MNVCISELKLHILALCKKLRFPAHINYIQISLSLYGPIIVIVIVMIIIYY